MPLFTRKATILQCSKSKGTTTFRQDRHFLSAERDTNLADSLGGSVESKVDDATEARDELLDGATSGGEEALESADEDLDGRAA